MLAKTVLVVWLLASRNDMRIQYVVRYPTEAQCMEAAKKIQGPDRWQAYPVQKADCSFDVTGSAK